jgi:hypothetical protein
MRTLKDFMHSSLGVTITAVAFVVSIALVVASFIIPPTGIIDPSVLTAVGEIGVFSTLCRIPDMIQAVNDGRKFEWHKGDTTIKIESDEDTK